MKRAWLSILSLLVAACGNGSLSARPDGGAGAGTSSSAGAGTGGASGLPCDVDAVLRASCQSCHASTPLYGAPMPLVTYEDTQAPAKSDPSRAVHELMKKRLHDAAHPMPPTGDLAAADLATLDAWLDGGTPEGDGSSCGGGTGGEGAGDVGPEFLPCKPTHTFTSHAAASGDSFKVPEQGADNLYQCFTFHSPFDGTTQATAWAPILGDERVLHHWILYKTKTPQEDGGVTPCQMPSDATFVSGWAPGGQNFVLPDDVGLELGGPDDYYILQVHYHNTSHYTDALDTSGVALCTTDTPRPHDAGIFTLGTVGIDIPPHAMGYQASGNCQSFWTKFLPQPLTMIASFPHMHGLGRKMRTEIARGSDAGPVETLIDVEHFSFDDQRYYAIDPPMTFYPGDAVRTTCTYDNPSNTPVHFGEKTEDEMCFDFVMLYPVSVFKDNRSCGLL